MHNSGINNLNYLKKNANNVRLLEFLKTVSPLDLEHMSLPEAQNFVLKGFMSRQNNVNRDTVSDLIQLSGNENPLKFDLHKPTSVQEKSDLQEIDLVANKLISGHTAELSKIQGLHLKALNSVIKQIDLLPKSLNSFNSYNSVSLPKRSILLDSRNKIISYDNNLAWNLIAFNTSQRGDINTQSDIQQIISISCNNFKFPIPTQSGNLQNITFYKKIRVGINELNSQGIEIINNNFYHFEFKTKQVGNYLECEPIASWIPAKIISQLSKITLNFYGNSELINLDSDRMLATYTAGNPTVFNVTSPHGLTTGDLVYIESGELQNKQGYIIAVLSATSFEISINTVSAGQVFVFFASKRIQLQLNFICLE